MKVQSCKAFFCKSSTATFSLSKLNVKWNDIHRTDSYSVIFSRATHFIPFLLCCSVPFLLVLQVVLYVGAPFPRIFRMSINLHNPFITLLYQVGRTELKTTFLFSARDWSRMTDLLIKNIYLPTKKSSAYQHVFYLRGDVFLFGLEDEEA